MAGFIYSLCALTALLCAALLAQAYRRSKYRLLLWGALCFSCLTLNNIILIMDKLIIRDIDLSLPRLVSGLFAVTILLYGLVWDAE
jgi:hypothetical protein